MQLSSLTTPLQKPRSSLFGSGPTKKFPGWTWDHLSGAILSRSHRSAIGIERLNEIIQLTRKILEIPDSHQIAILGGSTTGAMETALWSLLGKRSVDIFAWDVFGKLWVVDAVQQLKIPNAHIFEADFGDLPDLTQYNPSHDVIFTWNGTTAGVCVPNLNWIPQTRHGLTICDATSSAFALPLDWEKLDATAFSWQKGLGGEAGHGMLVLSPRALDQLQSYTPSWPIPRLFRLANNQQVLNGLFVGKTINTPSMLCVEDCIITLKWAESFGQKGLAARTFENFSVLEKWIDHHPYLTYLSRNKANTSPTSVCFKIRDDAAIKGQETTVIQQVCQQLASLDVAYDIKNHMFAPPSFRIWCGPTIETSDLELLTPWIDWALDSVFSNGYSENN